jgi:hypothetical protein
MHGLSTIEQHFLDMDGPDEIHQSEGIWLLK